MKNFFQDGVANGDEYFAELDYIETVEKYKEDYEAEVMEEEDEEYTRPKTPAEEEEEDAEPAPQTRPAPGKKRYNYSEDNDFMPAHQVKKDGDSGIR